MDDQNDSNRLAYDRIAPRWDAIRHTFFGREARYLDLLLAEVPVGARVLDLGCGSGRPMAEAIVARGREVIGIDQSEAMLALARRHLPDQTWVHGAMQSVELPTGYAAALLWDSLFHVERQAHEPILQRVLDGMPSGGRLMLTVGGSSQRAFHDTMLGERFFYDSHAPQQARALLARLGCSPVLAEYMNWPGGERDKGRYALVVRKN